MLPIYITIPDPPAPPPAGPPAASPTIAIQGCSENGAGVAGWSHKLYGVRAYSVDSSGIRSSSMNGTGVEAESLKAGIGVTGSSVEGTGVQGQSKSGHGVVGASDTSYGLRGSSNTLSGCRCSSRDGTGIEGEALNAGIGVSGTSKSGTGVSGKGGQIGGSFEGSLEGVHAVSHHASAAGVAGYNDSTGPGVFGKSTGGAAGFFSGNVVVTGDIRLNNADCAEEFAVSGAEKMQPGTVMVLGNDGAVSESQRAYDKCVAGVISGAGDYKPGIVLDKQQTSDNRQPIALLGKVFCKVDARFGAINVGDLLTTSPTPGHAMKASDPLRAFGAVIGKALRPLTDGQGLIPILIALQ